MRVFLLLFFLSYCFGSRKSNVNSATLSAARLRQLSGKSFNAFHEHTKNIAIVRVPGTRGNEVVRDYIVDELKALGVYSVELDSFVASTPKGEKAFHNIIATYNPHNKSRVLFTAHYDSKWYPEPNKFIAATDSAVPCAMLLDMAATLANSLHENMPWGFQIVFFDGEEAFEEWTSTDSLYGSKHLAQKWVKEGSIDRIELFTLLDLIGAANPGFLNWFDSTDVLFKDMGFMLQRMKKQKLLHDNNVKTSFFKTKKSGYVYNSIEDDHLHFLRNNVPVLHLISVPFPHAWHTDGDNLESLDKNSSEDLLALFRVFAASVLNLTDLEEV